MTELPSEVVPDGVRARFVPRVKGLAMHIREAGFEAAAPALLPRHGFPEPAYSWREVMVTPAENGTMFPPRPPGGRFSARWTSLRKSAKRYGFLISGSSPVPGSICPDGSAKPVT